jgi:hypothetical protein
MIVRSKVLLFVWALLAVIAALAVLKLHKRRANTLAREEMKRHLRRISIAGGA